MSNEEKLKKVLAGIFKIDAAAINSNTSPDTVEAWDSLNHLNLIIALEEAFDISFTETQTVEIMNYDLVKIALKECGVDI